MIRQTQIHFVKALTIFVLLLLFLFPISHVLAQTGNPNPPNQPIKLIFIHHSTGENWLADGYGDLGLTLGENNYFVSDTNYGWGPDAIGDRTDIPNWEEWFASPNTPIYMEALFNESGQHSSYTRDLADPGGENTIILFKSCFPNSDLYGSPDDPPGTYADMTISGAKYVYNTILPYFATRPDKLFIVITAPPLSDRSNAANARAFNNWLVNDWLTENGYSVGNVAVFDFYNILTGKDAHHTWQDGMIVHIPGSKDTLAYRSGDDHPNEAGSRKATEEFIPWLNAVYDRYARYAAAALGEISLPTAASQTAGETPAEPVTGSFVTTGSLFDFEGGDLAIEPFHDESTPSQMSCAVSSNEAASGSASLQIDLDIVSGSWGTCRLEFDGSPDLAAGDGLTFRIHAERAGIPYGILLYAGDPDNPASYEDYATTPDDSVAGWADVTIPWANFNRVEWEEDAGAPLSPTQPVHAMAFGFNGLEAGNNSGIIWVDDIHMATGMVVVESEAGEEPPTDKEEPDDGGLALPCAGGILLPLLALGLRPVLFTIRYR